MLALIMNHTYAQNADIRILRNIHIGRNTALDGTMHVLSQSTYPIAVAIPAGELIYGYAKNDSAFKQCGWQTVAGLGITTVITYGLKYSIQRERPYMQYPDIIPYELDDSYSFPSGHTSIAFATATSLAIHYRKWYIIAPAYLWAGTIGYSRMHLGAHYPSDVLVSAVIGAGSAWLGYKGQQWLQLKRDKRKQQRLGY